MKEVVGIESNKIGRSQAIQKDVPWGLARLSSKSQLDRSKEWFYNHDPNSGKGVDVYVIDYGIKINHPNFEGRARWGKNFISNNDNDETNHSTHVAGIIGSKIYGVAKKSTLIAVKVIDTRELRNLDVFIAAVEWVVNDKKEKQVCVINISLGMDYSKAFNTAVDNAVGLGCVVVVSTGNSNQDACEVLPASAPKAITVGATNLYDECAEFSNWKSVNVYAPSHDILSTSIHKNS
ncbi:proteinase B [Entomophthora muscae]|uniref:Proteinase B n=1 Tax=Entomophthora muscae TaxID=34485 RepID=A0ACC2RM31_9FUNG|nr:proteinase B [Entomophthora muscae]